MTGKQLFEKLSVRDHSGSDTDEYAQTLQMLHFHAGFNDEDELFYSLLEKAENEGKILSLPDYSEYEPDGYPMTDVILV